MTLIERQSTLRTVGIPGIGEYTATGNSLDQYLCWYSLRSRYHRPSLPSTWYDGCMQRKVLASGVFDIIHPGHVYFLKEARALGDHLTVLVTSDGHAERTKRKPHHAADKRASLVKSLEFVDDVFVGSDPYSLRLSLEASNPDVIALGHDQQLDEEFLKEEAAQLGWAVEVMRLTKLPDTLSTRDL